MSEHWATSGVDLHLEVGRPRGRTLEAALRDAVREGRLVAGARLPSTRSLASDLGIARNTVAAAYAQLVAEGWLEARQGSGTRVAARPVAATAPEPPAVKTSARAAHDLRAGLPDLTSFPHAAWLASVRRTLRAAPYDALGYPDPRGRVELRRAIAGYLARARGVDATPDRVIVCSGFRQALTLVCTALRANGARRLAVEELGHRLHRDLIVTNALEAPTLGVDGDGAVVDDARADALLLTPAHQFPLGVALAAHRRNRVVAWARERGGIVVEDDYDGEFRYDRQPIGALQALAPEHVIYAGTASKSLAPGLRLGWLVVPARLLEPTLSARELTDGPSALEQLTLADFIESGSYDRHVRRARLRYRRRRDRLVQALARRAPAARVTGIVAGLHAVVELPDGDTEEAAVRRSDEHGLSVEGLGAYRLGGPERAPALVVGYATPPEHAFTAAVGRLCAVLADVG
ncbi:MAG TPA: PLP-dependent aminotransferase family protein [Gaiellaceae bacterium]